MKIKKLVVLFNGPPGCGKDTIAENVNTVIDRGYKLNPNRIYKFAQPIKDMVRDVYCNGDQTLFNILDKQGNKDHKDEQFFGLSCRDVQIAFSETYMKPQHGIDIFGKYLARTISRDLASKPYYEDNQIFLVSDSGFRPEAEVLVKEFGVDSILLIRIHREGKTFSGDSRNYINLDDLDIDSYDVDNIDGKLEDTVNRVVELISNKINKGN